MGAISAYSRSWARAILLVGAVGSCPAYAAVTTLHAFAAPGGTAPETSLVQGDDGNLYGTTCQGGLAGGYGTVFRVTPAGAITTLVSFSGSNGSCPMGGLIRGSDSNFYGTTYQGGVQNVGVAFRVTPDGVLTKLVDFNRTNGAFPEAALIQGSDGNFYGTTLQGGTSNYGTVFRMAPNGSLNTVANFNVGGASPWVEGTYPMSGLVEGADGNFYGTTTQGGTYGKGAVFCMTPAGAVTWLASFNGANPASPSALTLAADGNLYGVTAYNGANGFGTVFRVSSAGGLTTVFDFGDVATGRNPQAPLILGSDGSLYGSTMYGGAGANGTLFRITLAGTLTTLASFSRVNGIYPQFALTQSADGSLYGTSLNGGATGAGAVFRLAPDGALTALVSFANSPTGAYPQRAPLLQASDGMLYGVTANLGNTGAGNVFRLPLEGPATNFVNLGPSNSNPYPTGGLLQPPDGNLYGTTQGAGSGTVFRLALDRTLTTLFTFNGSTNGGSPQAGLIRAPDGNFYGTARDGGSGGYGTIFRMTAGGSLTTLVNFNNANGASPFDSLVRGSDGNFYGTTYQGGASGMGTVFRMTPTGALTVLASFNGTNGSYPDAALVQGADGNYYGTTYQGGSAGWGTVFRITPSGTLTTLVNFNFSNGGNPEAALLKGNDGNFYGTTGNGGGPGRRGTLFRMTPAGALTTLWAFTGSDGALPQAPLIQAQDGNFYGTTFQGGPGGMGTVFRLDGPPPAPTNLSASAGNSFIQLTWNAVTRATSYNVYISTTASNPAPTLLQSGITDTQFVANGLTNDTTYYFTVRAVDLMDGAPSNEVAATPTSAHVALSPTTLGFGNVIQGTTDSLPITLTNDGGGSPLSISNVSVSGVNAADFAQSSDCPASLAASASCTLTVTFAPAAAGDRSAQVTIASNSTGGVATADLAGTGIARSASIVANPASIDFGSVTLGASAAAQSVTITNNGNVSVQVAGATAGGSNPADFAVTSNACTTLAVGASCTITFGFTPSARGTRSATEAIGLGEQGTTASVSVTGVGTSPAVTLSPSTLNFGSQAVGIESAGQLVTLTNSGNSTMTLGGISAGGDFRQSNDCSFALTAGSSCTITVTFTPTTAGTRSGSLSVMSDAPSNPDSMSLTGTGIQAAISATGTVSFGRQRVATTSTTHTVTVTNRGSDTLTVGALSVGGANATDFAITNNGCSTDLAPGGSCAISLTFTPNAANDRAGSLVIASNAPTSPTVVSLSGTGIQAAIATSGPDSFGTQRVGTTSAWQGVYVINEGSDILNIESVSLGGANPHNFVIDTSGCLPSLQPGQTCSIGVAFTPKAVGDRTALLVITSNAPTSPTNIPLSGTGIQAAIAVSGPLSFSSQRVATTSAPQIVTITNSGTDTLNVGALNLGGANAADFAVSNGCTSGVAPGASCTIGVTFTPNAPGSRTATLSISSNAPTSPTGVSLSGTGIQAALSTSGSLSFGTQLLATTGTSHAVTVTNVGTDTLNVGTLGLGGANATDFTIDANGCTSGVAPGNSCTISMTFTPGAAGTRTAMLSIQSNAPTSPDSISLQGTGIAPRISLSASSIAFGDQPATSKSGTRSVTVTNSGTSPLHVGKLTITGTNASDFTVEGTPCASAVAPSAACVISVTFTPSYTGARTATLQIDSDATNGRQPVALSGNGTGLCVSPGQPVCVGVSAH